jgi:hypothetical protein
MKEVGLAMRSWVARVVVGLYTTFVLQSLWNWFVTKALNVPEISYWPMYGILMVIAICLERNTLHEAYRWECMTTMVYDSIPDEKRAKTDETLKQHYEALPSKVRWYVFEQVIGNSITLGIGWVIHRLLTS